MYTAYVATIGYYDNDHGQLFLLCLGIFRNKYIAKYACEEKINAIKFKLMKECDCEDYVEDNYEFEYDIEIVDIPDEIK